MSFPFQSAPAERPLSPVSVCGVEVNRDAAGRFSLNDLHRASGGEKRHQPSDWLRLDQTQALVDELKKPIPGIPGVKEIQPVRSVPGAPSTGGGTFVVRELVYGYAMWISPAFHLTVIRTFDALATGQPWPFPGRGQGELFGPVLDPAKLTNTFGQFLRLGKLGGLDTEAARQVADRETRRLLGVSPLAVLGMTAPANAPTYAVVEPAPGPEVLPMTELLHRHGQALTAREVHAALERLGLLERRTLEVAGRPSRIYPVLVGDGLRYGDNVTVKASYLTSCPMYYPARFPELLTRITEANVVEAAVDPRAWNGKTTDQMSKRQREAYKASGAAEERKERKRREQRLARQEATLDALKGGETWSRVSTRLNLDYYFTPEERDLLRRGQPPIEQHDPGELPESLTQKPGEELLTYAEWQKTRH
jgi:hypothetical protein